jgi:putative AdoMet-dependent methyltransferase
MRQVTSERFQTLKIIDGDLLEFEVDGLTIDTIVSTYVFHHLTDVEKGVALKKYSELLEENGRVIFADTMFITEDAKQAQIVKERSRGFHNVADDLEREYYTTVPVLMDLFMKAGFDVACKQMNDYVWILNATKKMKK